LAQGKILFQGTPRELFQQTEILKVAGLEPPPITQLAQELNRAGLKIKSDVLTMEELVKNF